MTRTIGSIGSRGGVIGPPAYPWPGFALRGRVPPLVEGVSVHDDDDLHPRPAGPGDVPGRFRGHPLLGALAVVVLGPLVVLGGLLLACGLLMLFGVVIGPFRPGHVPRIVEWAYGGPNGFTSFVTFMIGALIGSLGVGGIRWAFTGDFRLD